MFASLPIQHVSSEDFDQTAQMRSLILILAGRTWSKIRFLTLRLIVLIKSQCVADIASCSFSEIEQLITVSYTVHFTDSAVIRF